MAESIRRDFAHIPVHGPGVPSDADYHVFPTTDWMPYSWSVNNVVMGENLHTALGFWQAGRAEEAFTLMKSALMASMYMGISPGNVGTMNYLDVYRRESQRDFADGAGVMSRAIIEGLFGIRPDALDGVLRVSPGFPGSWSEASLVHPDFELNFSRSDAADRWEIRQQGARFSRLKLRFPAAREDVRLVTVDGHTAGWRCDPEAGGGPILEIDCAFGPVASVTVEWEGRLLTNDDEAPGLGEEFTRAQRGAFMWWAPVRQAHASENRNRRQTDWTSALRGAVRCVDLSAHFNDRVVEIFKPG